MAQPAPGLDAAYVLTLEEVAKLAAEGGKPSETLMNVVALIARRFQTDVCSAYLLEPDRTNLVLAATLGLRPQCIGTLRLGLNEGLAGLVAEQVRPLAVEQARNHPRFKYFSEAGEDEYQSFLGVPLLDRGVLQGVLVVQTLEARTFREEEIRMLSAAAEQVAHVVSEARTLARFIAPVEERLWAVARNLSWSWDHDSTLLFRELDPDRWRFFNHNPIALLSEMPLAKLESRARDLMLHSRINYAYRRQRHYLRAERTWGGTHAGVLRPHPVAYFSAEFGIHESLPVYSGGLGVLAGDHIKSASDLDIPLVGIGLFYGQGYFRQRLDRNGWQQEEYLATDVNQLPMEPAIGKDGLPVSIQIHTRGATLRAKVWRLRVGRRDLLLLDSNVEGNTPEDRELTSRLYGGDGRVRIRQELLLGVGGYRALRQMGITPGVLHLNEGHSAFGVLEAIRSRMQDEGIDFHRAVARVSREVVFTTHTPVPAGHDRFDAGLIEEHLGTIRDQIGISHETLMGLGREDPLNPHESFCMTVLGLRLSRTANAVSSLHGQVSREMWTGLFPGKAEEAIPIGHITNGVHVPTWLAPQMFQLYDRHLGTGWHERSGEAKTWDGIEDIDDGELWETHMSLKARMLEFVRRRAVEQAQRREESPQTVESLRKVLSQDTLTIGFARRFATYKRANLFLRDIERLVAMVNDPKRPVQFVFAGKAHPLDEPGKRVLQQIAQLMKDANFSDRFVFVDYDINVGRFFVQGIDVWLNNPRRPLEASGTSGQKVVLNGGLNLSVLDGWWAEAYDGLNGFAIGTGKTHSNMDVHDARDGEDLYRTLREEVIPLYYQRDADGLPRGWIKRMKRTIRTLGWRFNADRMVMDYTMKCYIPAAGGTSSDMNR
jgi:starch phosphorylase